MVFWRNKQLKIATFSDFEAFSVFNVLTKLNNTPNLPTLIFWGHETGTTHIFHLGLIDYE